MKTWRHAEWSQQQEMWMFLEVRGRGRGGCGGRVPSRAAGVWHVPRGSPATNGDMLQI
ncbi:hypothetical protein JYU34_016860 [Plutella xylostella]|uniref:Uncharacterized protein n=1 Tax=Plutella xylostella TaxID=51655 RepID=A0ABQ7Q3M9_PLUXY|nr:hypothetical protein JYU34_016860 [Plutella xylostella]